MEILYSQVLRYVDMRMIKKKHEQKMMEFSISDVPEELHMFILSQLDGQSLVRAKRTCKMWACLIENLEKYFHIWLMCCINEISLFSLTEIMGYSQLKSDYKNLVKSFRKLPWMFWREIYAEYRRGFMVEWTSPQVVDLFYDQSHSMVTALSLNDGKLITGHEDGSVLSWTNVASGGLDLKLIHKHERMVTCMTVTSTCLDVAELLSGKSHTLVVTGSQDYGIFVSDITKQNSAVVEYYNKKVNSVSCFGPYLTSAASSSFIQGQSVWYISTDEELSIIKECKLEGTPVSNLVHGALTEDKVYMTDNCGFLYKWSWTDKVPSKPVIIVKYSSPVSAFIFKGNCITCLLECGDLIVSNDEGKEVMKADVHQSIQRKPECIAWREPIFALGTKGGLVFLYLVRDIDDFRKLDLFKPATKLTVEAEHINHIAIGDDGICPLVAIATEHLQLSLFRFHK